MKIEHVNLCIEILKCELRLDIGQSFECVKRCRKDREMLPTGQCNDAEILVFL